MNHDEMIAVILANKEGKVIEFQISEGVWTPVENNKPLWNFVHNIYRVKPEPKPDIIREYVAVPDATHIYTSNAYTKTHPSNLRLTYSGETGELISAEVLQNGPTT